MTIVCLLWVAVDQNKATRVMTVRMHGQVTAAWQRPSNKVLMYFYISAAWLED